MKVCVLKSVCMRERERERERESVILKCCVKICDKSVTKENPEDFPLLTESQNSA